MLMILRQLRHGRLERLSPVWTRLGRIYRKCVSLFPRLTVSQRIGQFGPFRMSAVFAFSDLESWGSGHNNGFQLCVEFARSCSVFFDVGAHVGYVTLPASSVMGKNSKVVSFEPSKANMAMLRLHVAKNSPDKVTIENVLVGADHAREMEFYESLGHHGQNSQKPVDVDKLRIEHGAFAKTTRKMVSLDGYCKETGLFPDLVKIDVEGAEIEVLTGAQVLLKNERPLIFLSVHPKQIESFGQTLGDLSSLIASVEYELMTMDGEPTSTLALEEYLMVPAERCLEIRKKLLK